MDFDIEGFVQSNVQLASTPPQKCLLPIFEAISNSIHSIQEAQKGDGRTRGRIEVTIQRDATQDMLRDGNQRLDVLPIKGFEIIDNGVGFNTVNYSSFNRAFGQLKRHLGAKGRGRFMWLKVFERADIASVFKEGPALQSRKFAFTIQQGCNGGQSAAAAPTGANRRTCVQLQGMMAPYKDHCPKHADVIAGHLVRRFVQYLALPSSPQIVLRDSGTDSEISLNKWFKDLKIKDERTAFSIDGRDFAIDHLLLKKQGDLKHELHFCAHNQAVAVEILDGRLSDLKAPIVDGSDSVVYHGYVSSEFLDHSVNPERTDFEKTTKNMLPYSGTMAWSDIVEQSVSEAAKFLDPYTRAIRAEKHRRVNDYVQNEAPWYRHVVTHRPEIVDQIAPGASQNEIDLTLYQASKSIEVALRNQASQLLESDETVTGPDDYRKKLDCFLEHYGDVGRDQLAKYVAHRKAILSFLFDRLRLREDGKYHFERDIHQVIFPMRCTSDDVDPDRTNLWIIDERLAFHYYLASDKPLRSIDSFSIDSGKELDVLIFDRPFLFGEGEIDIGAAVIIEFKRPMTDDRDPIRQIFNYVRVIRTGTVTKDGTALKVKKGTPFYAYVLCDLTPTMREYAEDAGLTETADGDGFIGYNGPHEVYVEVISYKKAISDAQKRNAILFHKLGLPPTLTKPLGVKCPTTPGP